MWGEGNHQLYIALGVYSCPGWGGGEGEGGWLSGVGEGSEQVH